MVSGARARREHSVWVTVLGGGVDHAVLQVDLAAGAGGDVPGCAALCGEPFLPAPMITEPGSPCLRCIRYLRARATLRSAEERLNALPKQRRERIAHRFLAMVMAKVPVVSSRPPRGASPDESTGRHARRDSDALFLGTGSRRASTFGGEA